MSASNEYASDYKGILDVLSREMDNIVLLTGDSNNNEFRVWAFSINQVNRRAEYITNLPDLSPGSTLSLGYFGENGHSEDSNVSDAGDDLLRIEDFHDETIEEFGIAVEPDDVLVGAENPPGAPILGVQGGRARGFDADDFSNRGAVRSQFTRTVNGLPTTALSATDEQGLIRIDSADNGRNRTYVGFKNVGEQTAPLQATVYGNTYRVTNVTDSQVIRDMLFGDGYKRRVLTWGGIKNQNPNIPDAWSGLEVSGDDIRNALGGGV